MSVTEPEPDVDSLLASLPETVEQTCEHARTVAEDGRQGRAVQLLERALDRCNHPDLHVALGTIYRRSGDLRSAIPPLERALEGREEADTLRMLAEACAELGRTQRAKTYLERLRTIADTAPSLSELTGGASVGGGPETVDATLETDVGSGGFDDARTIDQTMDAPAPKEPSPPSPPSHESTGDDEESTEIEDAIELDADEVVLLDDEDSPEDATGEEASTPPPDEELEAESEGDGAPEVGETIYEIGDGEPPDDEREVPRELHRGATTEMDESFEPPPVEENNSGGAEAARSTPASTDVEAEASAESPGDDVSSEPPATDVDLETEVAPDSPEDTSPPPLSAASGMEEDAERSESKRDADADASHLIETGGTEEQDESDVIELTDDADESGVELEDLLVEEASRRESDEALSTRGDDYARRQSRMTGADPDEETHVVTYDEVVPEGADDPRSHDSPAPESPDGAHASGRSAPSERSEASPEMFDDEPTRIEEAPGPPDRAEDPAFDDVETKENADPEPSNTGVPAEADPNAFEEEPTRQFERPDVPDEPPERAPSTPQLDETDVSHSGRNDGVASTGANERNDNQVRRQRRLPSGAGETAAHDSSSQTSPRPSSPSASQPGEGPTAEGRPPSRGETSAPMPSPSPSETASPEPASSGRHPSQSHPSQPSAEARPPIHETGARRAEPGGEPERADARRRSDTPDGTPKEQRRRHSTPDGEQNRGDARATRSSAKSEPPRSRASSHREGTPSSGALRRWWHRFQTWRANASSRRRLALVGGLAAGFVLAGLAAVYYLDRSRIEQRLQRGLAAVETPPTADAYPSYREALERARASLQSTRNGLVFGLLDGGADLHRMRRTLREQRVRLRAFVEYRFDPPGGEALGDTLESLASGDIVRPRLIEARIYRYLARGRPTRAIERAEKARASGTDTPGVLAAHLAALLEIGRHERAESTAEALRNAVEEPTTYHRYLFARVARQRDASDALERLQTLIAETDPPHLDARIERASILVDRESYDDAERQVRTLLDEADDRASPLQRARLHLLMGRIYTANDEPARAEEQYREATDAAPDRASVYLPLIDLYLRQGRLERATAHLDRARNRTDMPPALAKRRARLGFRRGRFARALETLAPTGEPPDAPLLEGRIHLARQRYRLALAAFERARDTAAPSREMPARVEAFQLLTRAYLGEAPAPLVGEMSTLLEQHSNDPILLRTAGRLRLRAARLDPDRRERHLREAERHLERARELQPKVGLTHYARCALFEARHEWSKAQRACRRAEQRNPDHPPGAITSVRLQLHRGDVEEAESSMKALYEAHPDQLNIVEWYVRTLVRAGKTDDAQEVLERWTPDDTEAPPPTYTFLQGFVAFAQADYVQALGYLSDLDAESLPRRRTEAALYRAHALVRLGDDERAETIVERHLGHPEYGGYAWLIFAELRRRQGRFRDALENLDRAEIDLDDGAGSTRELAELHVERARAWQARYGWDHRYVERNLEDARQRGDASYPDVQVALGLAQLRRVGGNPERAASHLERVADAQPYRCEALAALEEAYDRLERRDARDTVGERRRERC